MKKVGYINPVFLVNVGRVKSIKEFEQKLRKISVPSKPYIKRKLKSVVIDELEYKNAVVHLQEPVNSLVMVDEIEYYYPINKVIIKLECPIEVYSAIHELYVLSMAYYDGYYSDSVVYFKPVQGIPCKASYSALGFIFSIDGKTIKINC